MIADPLRLPHGPTIVNRHTAEEAAMAPETWHPVPGYPEFELSDQLRVRSKDRVSQYVRQGRVQHRKCESKVLKVNVLRKGKGYPSVASPTLRRPVGLHILVCRVFHGEPPVGKTMALHKDGDSKNFHPSNLYWGDARDNANDARRHGALACGARHGAHIHPERFKHNALKRRRLSHDAVAEIRSQYLPFHPTRNGRALAKKFSVDPGTIRKVAAGTTYKEL